jgi:hypothetical protein
MVYIREGGGVKGFWGRGGGWWARHYLVPFEKDETDQNHADSAAETVVLKQLGHLQIHVKK